MPLARKGETVRAQQTTMDFDIFELGGFTRPSVEDWEATARKAKFERERKERKARETREHAERQERDRRERERQARHAHRHESPYDVLGVRFGASKSEIRAAWVRLCREVHPDVGGSEAAMKRVNAAYNAVKKGAQ